MTSEQPVLTLSDEFRIGMIWAQTPNGVIGVDGGMPWRLPEDLAHFKATTLGHYVLHGRSSYEALPPSLRPLPGRKNIVLTTQEGYEAEGAIVAHSLEDAYTLTRGDPLWIVGGGHVYEQALDDADVLVISEVDLAIDGDTYAPRLNPHVWVCVQCTDWITSTTGLRFRVTEYRRSEAAHERICC